MSNLYANFTHTIKLAISIHMLSMPNNKTEQSSRSPHMNHISYNRIWVPRVTLPLPHRDLRLPNINHISYNGNLGA